jgi:hypothetical protein
MKIIVFLDITPCSLVWLTDVSELLLPPSTAWWVAQFIGLRRTMPEDSHLKTQRRENLKSRLYDVYRVFFEQLV